MNDRESPAKLVSACAKGGGGRPRESLRALEADRASLMGGSLAKSRQISVAWLGVILSMGTMLLASRGMFREQDETLAQLQELGPLAKFVCLSCGVCASLCLVEIVALSIHVSDSTVLVWLTTWKEKSRFTDAAERRGGWCKKSVNAFASCKARALMGCSLKSRQLN